MDIMYYREFTELANTLNFHEAARQLNMSQSALSKHILALEGFYGVQLLDRGKRRVALTEAGVVFYEQALKIWEAYEESITIMGAQSRPSCLKVTGLVDSPDEYFNMAKVLTKLQTAPVPCSLSTVTGESLSPRYLADRVVNEECDCAVAYFELSDVEQWEDKELLECVHICSQPIDAIVSSESRLAHKKALHPADMAGGTFVHLAGSHFTPIWNQMERRLRKCGIPFTARPQMVSNVYDYVNLDLHERIMLMPRKKNAIEFASNPRYRIIPIDDAAFTLNMQAIHLKSNDSDMLQVFLDAMRECYAE